METELLQDPKVLLKFLTVSCPLPQELKRAAQHKSVSQESGVNAKGLKKATINDKTKSQKITNSNEISEIQNVPDNIADVNHSLKISRKALKIISWLVSKYESAEDMKIPKAKLYKHYLQDCNKKKIVNVVNAANFGKLVHCTFTNVKSRRIRAEGNSRNYYIGIRIKQISVGTK